MRAASRRAVADLLHGCCRRARQDVRRAPLPTVWYAFTPSTSETVSASAGRNGFLNLMIVYAGDSLATLQEEACGVGGVTFQAEAGTTYQIQIVSSGEFEFQLDQTPPPRTPSN